MLIPLRMIRSPCVMQMHGGDLPLERECAQELRKLLDGDAAE